MKLCKAKNTRKSIRLVTTDGTQIYGFVGLFVDLADSFFTMCRICICSCTKSQRPNRCQHKADCLAYAKNAGHIRS